MDSIIPLEQKNTLAEYMILSGVDNRPPMLDKDLYDSWKSRMELYMQNREHGRMILESVENGPLIWPTVEENGVIRTKKYAELSAAKKIQADCDMKATNIILQGLPADIYSLVNHHRVAKDLWERGETLHKYYLRFTQLINDMNIYNMKIKQFQVNTKFLNSLPPEWKCIRTPRPTLYEQKNETPGGSIYWEPHVEGIPIPVEGTYYGIIDEALDMYTKYAKMAGFEVKKEAKGKQN
ncbi:hypothetical protein Tco_1392285 [Tanacetum coccineum]